ACCGNRFSVRYPAVELLTALLFLGAWLSHPPVAAIIGMLFIAFLVCATFIDVDHMIIPDRFSIGGMVLGVVLSFLFPQLHGIEGAPIVGNIRSGVTSIIGALVGAGLVYWIAVLGEIVFRKPAMGEGDVKFVGFIGAFCGWQGAVFAMFGGAFIGSIVLLPVLLVGRLIRGKRPVEAETASADGDPEAAEDESMRMGAQVPFGPMLAAAGALYFIGFGGFVDEYFNSFALSFF
ncbi:MAG: prepilin peptidase, partial [Verrucomicrobiota bacterium]